MRRLRKWLWITCVAGSVVVGVLAIGLGVASYIQGCWIGYVNVADSNSRRYIVTSELGSIAFKWYSLPIEWLPESSGWHADSFPPLRVTVDLEESALGFVWARKDLRGELSKPWSFNAIGIPHWFILLLCLPAPVIAWRRRRKRLRIEREGLCRVCGYDLRASESRCPECGTPFTASPGTGSSGE